MTLDNDRALLNCHLRLLERDGTACHLALAGEGDAEIFRCADLDLAVFSGAGGAGTSGTNDAGAFAAQVKKLR